MNGEKDCEWNSEVLNFESDHDETLSVCLGFFVFGCSLVFRISLLSFKLKSQGS